MKYELNENQLNNLIVFLDRVELKGIKEIQAINEILSIFTNPTKEQEKEKIISE